MAESKPTNVQSAKARSAPIVEPGGVAWPWSRGGRDLDIGRAALDKGVTFRSDTVESGPPRPTKVARRPAGALAPRKDTLLAGVARPIIALLLAFHLAPHLADTFGLGFLVRLAGLLPFGDLVEPAIRSWAFQPTGIWVIALILRFVGLNIAKKEPIAGLVLALLAFGLDAVSWLFIGRPLGGDGALRTLLLAEAALLAVPLGLAWAMAQARRRDVG
ncbi:hypothetical protein GVN21_00145 [Caulobacter sp. SLTY]|uniref:hypothetical protein n=1 Tax=Caulobacter sp. SLTY TaxID=2683262 RepID=UPI001411DD33|nr:hypothetical protein [Caulobacter sp. SLTY]NBB13761.1 hypothetical protein [Caulobacter sp. SLTY]